MSQARVSEPSRAADAEVSVVVVGVDFRVASSAWRNRLLLAPEEREALTAGLRRSCAVDGLVVLETCNRIEWILATSQPRWAGEVLRAQMQDRWLQATSASSAEEVRSATLDQVLPVPYLHVGLAAVTHILRVAVGLESFVVGEREIAGQLNRAVVDARGHGHASPLLNALQTAVGRTVRKVQRVTHWRHPARGVHGLAFAAATRGLPVAGTETRRTAVVVGMGEIGRKAAALFASSGWKVVRVNRTVPEDRLHEWRPLHALVSLLEGADTLVVATGAHRPVVDLRQGPQPRVVVDLGAPAQIHAHPGMKVHGLDELLEMQTVRPLASDEQAVRDLVDEGVAEFMVECRKRDLAGLLRATHDAYERASYDVLPALLDTELGEALEPDRRRRLHFALRELLRGCARDIVQHIEAAAQSRPALDPGQGAT